MVEYRELAVDPDYRVGTDGSVWSRKRGDWVLLKGSPNRKGHLYVSISGDRKSIHVLVLETFVGLKPRRNMEGRHLNDVKSDNRLENLAWGTRKQNAEDACRNGTLATKLTAETARWVVMFNDWEWSGPMIARFLGVCSNTVRDVLIGKTWSHATGIKKVEPEKWAV